MKSFFRTLISLLLSVVFAYAISYFCLLFARNGEMDAMQEFLYLYLHHTSGDLWLRIVFPLTWVAAFCYMTSIFSVNRDLKSAWTNEMLGRPYVYTDERARFWQKGEWLALLIPCLVVAALVPAGNLFGPWVVMFLVRTLLFFAANRVFIAINRYAWCRDRLGGLEGRRD